MNEVAELQLLSMTETSSGHLNLKALGVCVV